MLDIHAPKGAKAAPVVIYVHGGYWKAGGKANKGHLPEFFCRRGFVFVTINYRLDPESLVGEREMFVYYTLVGDGPSQLHRCQTGVLWKP